MTVLRAIASILVASLCLLACGKEGGRQAGSNPALNQLVSGLEEVDDSSVRFRMRMRVDTVEDGRFSADAVATMNRSEEGRMRGVFRTGTTPAMPVEMILGEGVMWMTSPTFAGDLPPGKRWIRTTDPEFVAAPTLTPRQVGEMLKVAGSVEELGRDRVQGVSAVHLRGTVDLTKLAGEMGDQGESLERLLGGRDSSLPMDVWMGPDARPVRYRVSVRLPRPGGGRPQTVHAAMDIEEYDVPVDIRPPPRRLVTGDELLQQG